MTTVPVVRSRRGAAALAALAVLASGALAAAPALDSADQGRPGTHARSCEVSGGTCAFNPIKLA